MLPPGKGKGREGLTGRSHLMGLQEPGDSISDSPVGVSNLALMQHLGKRQPMSCICYPTLYRGRREAIDKGRASGTGIRCNGGFKILWKD